MRALPAVTGGSPAQMMLNLGEVLRAVATLGSRS